MADKSFSVAFPTTEKHRNAILFCQSEILSHINENLTTLAKNALADAKNDDPEDVESKLGRIIVTSLVAYANFINDVCQNDDVMFGEYLTKNCEAHLQILSPSSFWKFGSHKNPAVRAAWFTVASCLCQKVLPHYGIIDEKLESKLASHILGKLDENDASVASIVWEASLHLTQNSRNWNESVNVEKQV